MGDSYKIEDYQLFNNAKITTNTLNNNLDNIMGGVKNCNNSLSNNVFEGPIADSCKEAIAKFSKSLSSLHDSFTNTCTTLGEISDKYRKGDKDAVEQILSKLTGTNSALTITNEADLPTITIDQVRSCKDVSEYLKLVMPVYQYYCKKYGIKYPGVLALQPVHEHSAPTGISAPSATADNNLGGLKYKESIPNATVGTAVPADEGNDNYCHFDNVTKYIEAACWNIQAGTLYQNALAQNNMADFTTSLVNTWVGHSGNYGPSIVNEYSQYGLEKYEL